jgi:hypothetical protein
MERRYTLALVALSTGLMAGCASDSGGLFGPGGVTTSSVSPAAAPMPAATAAAAQKVDPTCVALTAQIDGLRKEGVAERIEKVSTGKTKSVSIKRDALAKMIELDKANAEFVQKCSTLTPKSAQTAAVAAPVAAAAVTAPTPATVRPVPAAAAAAAVAPVALTA